MKLDRCMTKHIAINHASADFQPLTSRGGDRKGVRMYKGLFAPPIYRWSDEVRSSSTQQSEKEQASVLSVRSILLTVIECFLPCLIEQEQRRPSFRSVEIELVKRNDRPQRPRTLRTPACFPANQSHIPVRILPRDIKVRPARQTLNEHLTMVRTIELFRCSQRLYSYADPAWEMTVVILIVVVVAVGPMTRMKSPWKVPIQEQRASSPRLALHQ